MAVQDFDAPARTSPYFETTIARGSVLPSKATKKPFLLQLMLRRLNVDIGQAADFYVPCLEQAVSTCMGCDNTDTCKTWLQEGNDDNAWQMFCPNARSLGDLPRRRLKRHTLSGPAKSQN